MVMVHNLAGYIAFCFQATLWLVVVVTQKCGQPGAVMLLPLPCLMSPSKVISRNGRAWFYS